MFVKVYRGSLNESVYECRSYHLFRDADKVPSMRLEFFDKEDIVLRDLVGSYVYVTNDSGVTVDTYRFDQEN